MVKKIWFIGSFIFLFVPALAAFDFDFPAAARVPKTFCGQKLFIAGDSPDITFESGMVFENPISVKVGDFGQNILVIKKTNSLKSFPSSLGNAVVVLHDGFQAVYGNLADVQNLYTKETLLKDEGLGPTETAKDGKTAPLLFRVFDVKNKNNIYNPLLFLPEITDREKPELQSVYLQNADGRVITLSANTGLKSGHYKIFVEAYDTVTKNGSRLAPIELTAVANGNTIETISFSSLKVKNGKMYASENLSLAEIYRRNGAFYLGELELIYGNSTLVITVRDYAKNQTERVFNIAVF